jgi:hypothetical protein
VVQGAREGGWALEVTLPYLTRKDKILRHIVTSSSLSCKKASLTPISNTCKYDRVITFFKSPTFLYGTENIES